MTIIFAKNQLHAEFIGERFDKNYPNYKGAFARVTHSKLTYAQLLTDAFSEATSAPHIAISVDMLDTGIDVPEVVNLVPAQVREIVAVLEQVRAAAVAR